MVTTKDQPPIDLAALAEAHRMVWPEQEATYHEEGERSYIELYDWDYQPGDGRIGLLVASEIAQGRGLDDCRALFEERIAGMGYSAMCVWNRTLIAMFFHHEPDPICGLATATMLKPAQRCLAFIACADELARIRREQR